MLSVLILLAFTLAQLLFTAWAVALTARLVGAQRAKLLAALIATLIIGAAGVLMLAVASALDPSQRLPTTALGLVAQLLVAFFAIRRAFRLSRVRSLIPFAAFYAANFVFVLLTLLILRPFMLESFSLNGRSMTPSFNPGDRFIANKLLQPRRWDLVVFRANDSDARPTCQRVVGLPGEKLRFENEKLLINGAPLTPPPPLTEFHAAPPRLPKDQVRYKDGQTVALGPDEFFVFGDNFDLALDSRLTGPVRRNQIIGVVDVIYWPVAQLKTLR